jgi:hypothetical protein
MVDKFSSYECLDTYEGDILIWRKDPTDVKKSSKVYMLKSVGIPDYYLFLSLKFLERHRSIRD